MPTTFGTDLATSNNSPCNQGYAKYYGTSLAIYATTMPSYIPHAITIPST